MGKIDIVWTGNATVATRAAESVIRKTERMQAEFRRLTGTATKAADVQAQVSRAVIKSAGDAAKVIANEQNAQAQLAAKIKQAKDAQQAQAEQAIAKAAKATEATRKQAAEQDRLAAAIKKTYQEGRAPQTKFAARMRELNELVKAGKIGQDEYRDAAKRAAAEAMAPARLAMAQRAAAKTREATKATRQQRREQEKLGAAAKRVLQQIQSPQERYNAKMRELNVLLKRGKLNQDQYGRAAKQAADEAKTGGDEQFAIGQKVLSQVSMIAGALGIGTGIAGAIALMKQGFENSLQIMREITNETAKASGEIVAFAALQEGGTKGERVMAAADLATRFGITERGVAFDTVQAMQSMLGDFEQGMNVSADIFAAAQVGIPVELGKELEIRGIASGMAPGEAVRKAFVAGELSGRTPAELPKAAEALPYWEDKNLMFAVAGQLAASAGDQISTYMKRLGQSLSPVGGLEDWYEEQGIPEEATQFERLKALSEQGMDTQTVLKRAGLNEQREVLAVMNALQRFDQIAEDMRKIPQLATPGLFAEKRAGIEAELPWMQTTREMQVAASTYAEGKAFGEGSAEAMGDRLDQVVRGLAFQRLGIEQIGPFRTYEEEQIEGVGTVPISTRADIGQAGFGTFLRNLIGTPLWGETPEALQQGFDPMMRRVRAEEAKIREELAATAPRPANPPVARGGEGAATPAPQNPGVAMLSRWQQPPARPIAGSDGAAMPAAPAQSPALDRAAASLDASARRLADAAEEQQQAARAQQEVAAQQQAAVDAPPERLNRVGLR